MRATERRHRPLAPRIVHDVLATPGRRMDPGPRRQLESRFQHDFSRVAVHSGPQADASAKAMSALAYTVGPHIVLSNAATASRAVLAHELMHVIQQGDRPIPSALRIGDANDAHEYAASHASPSVQPIGGVMVQRLEEAATPEPAGYPICTETIPPKCDVCLIKGTSPSWHTKGCTLPFVYTDSNDPPNYSCSSQEGLILPDCHKKRPPTVPPPAPKKNLLQRIFRRN